MMLRFCSVNPERKELALPNQQRNKELLSRRLIPNLLQYPECLGYRLHLVQGIRPGPLPRIVVVGGVPVLLHVDECFRQPVKPLVQPGTCSGRLGLEQPVQVIPLHRASLLHDAVIEHPRQGVAFFGTPPILASLRDFHGEQDVVPAPADPRETPCRPMPRLLRATLLVQTHSDS